MPEIASLSLASDADLISYYRLENVSDSKGSNTLTNNNTVAFNTAKYGLGADFGASNTNKYLSRADNLGIAGNSDLSFSFWYKGQTEIGSGVYTFFVHTSTTTADRYIQLNYEYNGGTLRLALDAAGTSTTFNVALGTSVFNHIVVTRNVAGNAAKVYLNNVEVISSTVGSGAGGSNAFSMGASTVGGNPTSAIFDDFAVFDRVLTPAEVSTIYTDVVATNNAGFFMFL